MKTILTCAASFVLIFFSCCAFAADSQRIGVVNQQTVLEQSNLGKNMRDRLQKEAESRQKELESKQAELQKKQQAWTRDKDILPEKERNQKEQEFARIQKDIQRMYEQFQSEFEDRRNNEFQEFERVFNQVITKLAKQEQVDIVIPEQVTVYAGAKVNITNKVLTALNAAKTDKG